MTLLLLIFALVHPILPISGRNKQECKACLLQTKQITGVKPATLPDRNLLLPCKTPGLDWHALFLALPFIGFLKCIQKTRSTEKAS